MTHRRPGSSSIQPLVDLPEPMEPAAPRNPRRGKTYMALVYIADGFADDCEEFILRCTRGDQKLTYSLFVQTWHEMNFSSLYQGRTCGAEIAELSEEVIRIAKHYMIANTSNFEENVCGLFLVYALLNLQPYSEFASLRLVPEDMDAINHIESVARKDKRLDILYILGSVLVKGPVQYQADNRERGMESALRKYVEGGCMTIDRLGVRPKGVFYRQNPVLDTLRDMKNAYRKYESAKSLITTLEENLNYVKISDAEALEASHKQLINGITAFSTTIQPSTENPKKHYETVKDIKAKAMKNAISAIKHRSGVEERRKTDFTSPPKQDIRSKPEKVKSGSPKKPLITNSPRAPKVEHKYSPKRKKVKKEKSSRKRKYYTSSSSDTDCEVTVKLDGDSDLDDDDGRDLDLDEYIERLRRKEKAQQDVMLNVQELNMQLDTLPIYIRSENNDNIEIELIDHSTTHNSAKEIRSKEKVTQAKVMSLPDISFQKIYDTTSIDNSEQPVDSVPSIASLSSIRKNDDEIFKKPILINQNLTAKSMHNDTQPSTSKETMELINKSKNITNTNSNKKVCPEITTIISKKNRSEKATTNNKTISPKKNTANNKINSPKKAIANNNKKFSETASEIIDTPARVTRCRSKDFISEACANDQEVNSEDKPSTSKEIITSNKNSNTINLPSNKKPEEQDNDQRGTKVVDEECIVQLPLKAPRNRRPLSPNIPVHIGDVDMIEEYLPIHGRTKRISWNRQDPDVAKNSRDSSFTISVETINSVDSMTTVFHDAEENVDCKVNNKSPNVKDETQMSLSDHNSTTIDHHNKNGNTGTSLPNLNSIAVDSLPDINSTADKNSIEANKHTEMGMTDLNSTTFEHHYNKINKQAKEKSEMSLSDVNSTVDKTIMKAKEKKKISMPDLDFTTVSYHHNKGNKKAKEKTEKNCLPDMKANETSEMSMPDLNLEIDKPYKSTAIKRSVTTSINTDVPSKKNKRSEALIEVVDSVDIVNTSQGHRNCRRNRSPEMPSLDSVENMARVTRSQNVSPKISDDDIFDEPEVFSLTTKLKKPEKRQQKQIHRKSKFKKMGIMEIADLDKDRTD